MDLPDCPPGAEGYEDSVVQVPKKFDEATCTKAEQEFQDHLNSLKIKLEDDSTRPMVERKGRDVSGKWIYLCFPCAAMCSGENILQTHISGKKHKTKLQARNVWPLSIFEDHPYVQNEKGTSANKGGASEKTLQKMAEEVDLYNKNPTELDEKFSKYRSVECQIQEALDKVKAPLIGLEYLIEHPPQQSHYEPSYMCTLCQKQGHPRTIINHLTCYWHRTNYMSRHYPKATYLLAPFKNQNQYREGVLMIINRFSQRIEDKFGRRRPVYIEKDEYEKEKEAIHQWIFKGYHFCEADGATFEEVVDVDLIVSLHKSNERQQKTAKKDPSPPHVAAPQKPLFNSYTRPAGRNERRAPSVEDLSDISGDERATRRPAPKRPRERSPATKYRDRREARDTLGGAKAFRLEPYHPRPSADAFKTKYALKNPANKDGKDEKAKPPNYEYKLKLASDKTQSAIDSAKKTLAYHEKNPEKHPLYPEEWKKFWNRRYKEIQAEGKDPSKHDFKPEWIVYWTGRMKVLHEEELRGVISEIYRKLSLTPPPAETRRSPDMRRSPDKRSEPRRSPDKRSEPRRSPDKRFEPRRRSPDFRRRSPEPRRRSPEPRRRSPEMRRRSPELRHRSSELRHRSPELRRRSPEPRRRSPGPWRSPDRRGDPEPRRRDPVQRTLRTRSRSPLSNAGHGLRRSSPARANIQLESLRRSQSPLSRREQAMRNRSPAPPSRDPPAMQTVTISDDEFKPDGLSPWNSDDDIDSLGSLPDARSPVVRPRSRAESSVSRHSRSRHSSRYSRQAPTQGSSSADYGAPDNVVATLRLLVALEDYLGSLGPKIVDLLTEALKMEKEKANSSEDLLEREDSVALMETAKEKLKGAVQAGLVAPAATQPVRSAVVRVASLLHEADRRASNKKNEKKVADKAAVPVAGVGEVDRAQIAQQMAAALIAQGKTDVSSEELAQLVDAVVGMAEAKKREAQAHQKAVARPPAVAEKITIFKPTPSAAPTASALQMLQSAYDEYDKKVDKDEAPDAMDGLSDSDLETLLKNFNELSAEEQHSLIAYLKKLEAKEPKRVERLREYVSAAAATAPAAAEPEAEPQKVEPAVKTVTIESDDDDYAVEEVFNTAKQKVKEDQIRQEMEIVTKSLQEAKPTTTAEATSTALPGLDIIKSSSAANLLAMVQASISQTLPPPAQKINPAPEVVASSTHPRSFGDLPEAPMEQSKPIPEPTAQNPVPGKFNQGRQNMPQSQNFGNTDSMNDMRNTPPSNENLRNIPINDNLRSIPVNDSGNMGMGDRNMSMNRPGNMGMSDRNMPMNDPGNMGMNNRNMPISDSGNHGMNDPGNMGMNNRNMPINDSGNHGMSDRNMSMNDPGNMGMNNRNMPINDSGNHGMSDRNMSMNDPGNMGMNNRNMPINDSGNHGMSDRNMSMNDPGNMGMNNRNMPINDSGNHGMSDRNMSMNDPGNMGMNNRNMPMNNNQGNIGMNNRNMPMSDLGNAGMNNRNMSMYDNTRNMPMNDNMRNMPVNDNNMRNTNMRNIPMNDNMRNMPMNDNNMRNMPMNDNFNQGGRMNPWESRPPMNQNMGGGPVRGNFNQGPRGGGNFMNGSGMQQDRFNNPNQYGNNQNFGGGGRGGGRGGFRGRGRGSFY